MATQILFHWELASIYVVHVTKDIYSMLTKLAKMDFVFVRDHFAQ